ncbi:MAG TPA: hypothetical protein VIQ74_13825 [Gemmatimonadaceae bacterium]|jgi:hypothetical protein
MTRLSCTRAAASVLAVVGTFAAAALPAQATIKYAPVATRYHLISVITRSQEQGGQKTEFKITNEQQVSVQLSEHGKDTLDFAYTLDSSRVVSNPPVQLPDVSRLAGTKVNGSMSRSGKVYAVTSNAAADNADAKNLIEGMSKFLLVLPENAAVGSSWTDTTVNSVGREGNNLDMSSITTSRVVGDTTYQGQKAWRVQRTSVLALNGNQSQSGQALRVEGAGTGSGMYYVSTAGVYLGSFASQSMNLQITIPATGEKVPVKQAVTSTVELLK